MKQWLRSLPPQQQKVSGTPRINENYKLKNERGDVGSDLYKDAIWRKKDHKYWVIEHKKELTSMSNTSFTRQGKQVWNTKIYFIFKVAKKMDQSQKGKNYDWELMNK